MLWQILDKRHLVKDTIQPRSGYAPIHTVRLNPELEQWLRSKKIKFYYKIFNSSRGVIDFDHKSDAAMFKLVWL